MDDDKSCEGTLKNNAENKQLWNCGYERIEKLACSVFHFFSPVEECSEVRFSQLCNYCFYRHLLLGFYTYIILYCRVVSELDNRGISLIKTKKLVGLRRPL